VGLALARCLTHVSSSPRTPSAQAHSQPLVTSCLRPQVNCLMALEFYRLLG